MVLRMARLIDDADYDAGETPGNVPCLRFNFGNDYADNRPRTRCVPISLPTNMTMLRKQGETTSKNERRLRPHKRPHFLVFIPTIIFYSLHLSNY
ncbi:unnamed protein product [Protopolystoma xenopodis]|uniref:Uncharacterized protein n=1 Tax=Protopolystoma xenopodis TaxID=117903 RepID=A0A448XMZ9_9PLAT|nr:unnamed protein product [Protopolystoma xenopodis]